MDLYDAVLKRKSIRSFENRKIDREILNTILEYAKSVKPLVSDIEYNIEIVDCGKKVLSAPYYVAIYSEEKDGCAKNAGYIMQHIVMYLTVMGLGTCYKASSLIANKDAVGRKKVIAVAFGYTKEECFREPLEAKRHSMSDICLYKEEPSPYIYKLIEAVRMAPSSLNSQPWRMVVYKDVLHIYNKKPAFLKNRDMLDVNMGIALANIDISADNQWIDIAKKCIPQMKDKGGKHLEYLISIKNVTFNPGFEKFSKT